MRHAQVITGFLGAGKTTLINYILTGKFACTGRALGAYGPCHQPVACVWDQDNVWHWAAAAGAPVLWAYTPCGAACRTGRSCWLSCAPTVPVQPSRAAGNHGKRIAIIENEYGEVRLWSHQDRQLLNYCNGRVGTGLACTATAMLLW